MLSMSLFGVLFIIVLIILTVLGSTFLFWLAHVDSKRRRKKDWSVCLLHHYPNSFRFAFS
jgi:heme/copper-type cytochrome/quinol oxidase subunit 2